MCEVPCDGLESMYSGVTEKAVTTDDWMND